MINLLKESKLFAGCTGEEIADIANVAQKIRVQARERIFAAGEPAEYLYVVLEGAVSLRFEVSYFDASREITLDRKQAGEAFGWSVFVEPSLYTLSAFAESDAELMKVRRQDLAALCEGSHHLGFVIMKNISEIIAGRYGAVQNMLVGAIQQDLQRREL